MLTSQYFAPTVIKTTTLAIYRVGHLYTKEKVQDILYNHIRYEEGISEIEEYILSSVYMISVPMELKKLQK